MRALRAADYSALLELTTEALNDSSREFPNMQVTSFTRDLFQAEFAGAGEIDRVATASRRWADFPGPLAMAGSFHSFAVTHPLFLAYQRTSRPVPMRLSDADAKWHTPTGYGGAGMSRVLIIPLEVTPRRICAIALGRGGADYTNTDVKAASELGAVLRGLYATRVRRLCQCRTCSPEAAQDIRLTSRELAVLGLMADGLITAAIGHRLAISPRTVSKHMESLYAKLGVHDRTSAVLRGQRLGLLAQR